MTPRPPRDEQKAILLALVRQIAPKPLLIGHAAMHLGWWATLYDTEAVLEELVRDGVLRYVTKKERWDYGGIRFGYMLV